MDNNDYRAEKLSDVRIVELLGMAITAGCVRAVCGHAPC